MVLGLRRRLKITGLGEQTPNRRRLALQAAPLHFAVDVCGSPLVPCVRVVLLQIYSAQAAQAMKNRELERVLATVSDLDGGRDGFPVVLFVVHAFG